MPKWSTCGCRDRRWLASNAVEWRAWPGRSPPWPWRSLLRPWRSRDREGKGAPRLDECADAPIDAVPLAAQFVGEVRGAWDQRAVLLANARQNAGDHRRTNVCGDEGTDEPHEPDVVLRVRAVSVGLPRRSNE